MRPYPLIFESSEGDVSLTDGIISDFGEDSGSAATSLCYYSGIGNLSVDNVTLENSPNNKHLNGFLVGTGPTTTLLSNCSEKASELAGPFIRVNGSQGTLLTSNNDIASGIVERFGGTLRNSGNFWTWIRNGVPRFSVTKPSDPDSGTSFVVE